jgi:hypothetical protein
MQVRSDTLRAKLLSKKIRYEGGNLTELAQYRVQHDKESSGFLQSRELLDRLSNCQLSRKSLHRKVRQNWLQYSFHGTRLEQFSAFDQTFPEIKEIP